MSATSAHGVPSRPASASRLRREPSSRPSEKSARQTRLDFPCQLSMGASTGLHSGQRRTTAKQSTSAVSQPCCSDTNRIAKQLDMKNKLRTNNSCSLAWVGLEDSREHISKLRRRAAVQGRSQLQVSASASAPKTCQTEKQFTEFSGFARG